MKRVLLVIDTLGVGGAERSVVEIARHFHRFEPLILTCYSQADALPVRACGVPVISICERSRYAFGRVARGIRAAVEAFRPDVVHATLFRSEIGARLALRGGRPPLVGSFVSDGYGDVRLGGLKPATRLKVNGVRAVDLATTSLVASFMAISETVKRSNALALHLDPRQVRVIPRGRDVTQYAPMKQAARLAVRRRLGWQDDDFVLLSVGRLVPGKAQDEIIRAVSRIRQKLPRAKLVLAGDGPLRHRLEQLAGQTSRDSVEFLGARHDVPELLAACDVFVFPSHHEGQGGALVEAMLSGCRIAASDTPVHREAVAANVHGLLFPVGDEDGLADAVTRLCVESAASSKMAKAARSRAILEYDISRVAAAHEEWYLDVIARH